MGLLGSLFGSSNYNKNIRDLKKAKREAQDIYTQRANEDYMNTTAARSALTEMRNALRERTKSADATAAVSGATDESVALQKQNANESVGNTIRSLAAQGTQRSDNAMNDYLNATKSYNAAIAGQRTARAQQQSAALQGLINAGTQIATAGISGAFKKDSNNGN